MAKMNIWQTSAFVEDALHGFKRWRRKRSVFIWRNGRAEEPDVAMAHPDQGHSSVEHIAPVMGEVGIQPTYLKVGQEKMLLVPGFTQERETSGFTHYAMASIAPHQVASVDLLVLTCLRDVCNNDLRLLGEADQLRAKFHLLPKGRQAFAQHGLSMLLVDHQKWAIGRRHRLRGQGWIRFVHKDVVVIVTRRGHAFIIRKKGFENAQILKHVLGAHANAPAARANLRGWRLLNDTAVHSAPREIKSQSQTNRTSSNHEYIDYLFFIHRKSFPLYWHLFRFSIVLPDQD